MQPDEWKQRVLEGITSYLLHRPIGSREFVRVPLVSHEHSVHKKSGYSVTKMSNSYWEVDGKNARLLSRDIGSRVSTSWVASFQQEYGGNSL